MPKIDYVVLADYVRQDAGMTHIMGAGIDTIAVPEGRLPTAFPAGVAARIMFDSTDKVGAEHEISLEFRGPSDGLLRITQRFPTPPPPPGVPEHWRTAVSLAFRLVLPVPAHGDYALQVMLDDDLTLSRTLDVRAIPPQPSQD